MPGFLDDLLQRVKDEISLSKGMLYSGPMEALKGLGSQAMNAAQALHGFDIAGLASGQPAMPLPGATQPPPQSATDYVRAVPFVGPMLGAAEKRMTDAGQTATYNAALAGREPNLDDYGLAAASAAKNFVLKDILPGEEIGEILNGKRVTGTNARGEETTQALTPEETGKLLFSAGSKLLPLAGMVGDLAGPAELGKATGPTKSIGEIANAASKVHGISVADAIDAIRSGTPFDQVPNVGTPTSPEVVSSIPPSLTRDVMVRTPEQSTGLPAKLNEAASVEPEQYIRMAPALLDVPEFRDIVTEAVRLPAFRDFMKTYDKGKYPIGDWVNDMLRNGTISSERLSNVIKTHGLSPAEAQAQLTEVMGNLFEATKGHAGAINAALAEPVQRYHDEIMARAASGDKESLKILNQWKNYTENPERAGWLGSWDKFVNWTNNGLSRFRRSMVIGTVETTMRIAASQANVGLIQAFEHAVSGSIESMVGKSITDAGRSIGDHFGDLAADAATFVGEMTPSGRASLSKVIDSLPYTKMRLLAGSQLDLADSITMNMLKGTEDVTPGNIARAIPDTLATTLTIGHRLNQNFWRQFFFRQRLDGNLDALGFDSIKDPRLMDALQAPKMDDGLRSAIEDAEVHALKQTMAWTPQSGILKGVLNFYAKFPFSHEILPTFPRFMMNVYRWQVEHAPTKLLNVFSSEFRDQLTAGGLDTRMASRELGKGMAGLMMLNGAYVLRNSPEVAGPKYYLIKNGTDEKGNDTFIDARSYLPMAPMLFYADLMNWARGNKPMNLSASEWGDALLSIRNMASTPMFALDNLMTEMPKTVNNEVDIPVTLKKMLGDFAGSFFTPLKSLDELYGATVRNHHAEALRKDTRGHELFGSTLASIPGAATSTNPLLNVPNSINVFTGEPYDMSERAKMGPIVAPKAVIKKATGAYINTMTPLEELVARNPNLNPNTLAGNHGSEDANNEVRRQMGRIFQLNTPKGRLDNLIAQRLGKLHLPPDVEAYVLEKTFFDPIRQTAVARAKAANPSAFVHQEISKLPATLQHRLAPRMAEAIP